SAAVRSEVRRRLGGTGPIPLITVAAPKDSYTLVFSASSTSPALAQRIVTAYVDSYVSVRWESALKDLADARAPIEGRLAEVNQDVENTARAAPAAPDNQRQPLQTRLAALLNER